MSISGRTLICTDNKELSAQIEDILHNSEVTPEWIELEGKEKNEDFKSQIEKLKEAKTCLFIVKREKDTETKNQGIFMDFSMREVEEEALTSFEERLLYLESNNGIVELSKKEEEKLREIILDKEAGKVENLDKEERLLLRILEVIQVYANRGKKELAIEFCQESIEYMIDRHMHKGGEDTHIWNLEDRLACLYWHGDNSRKRNLQIVQEKYVKILEKIRKPARWRRGVMRCSNNAAYMFELQKQYTEAEKFYKQAEEYARLAFESDERIRSIQYTRANILRLLGNYNEAEMIYEEGRKQEENILQELYGLALTQFEYGKYEQAIGNFNAFCERIEGNLEKYMEWIVCKEMVASSCYNLKRYKKAKEMYEAILVIKEAAPPGLFYLEDRFQTMYNLALSYKELQERENLKNMYLKIRKLVEDYKKEEDLKHKEWEKRQLNTIEDAIEREQGAFDENFSSLAELIKPYSTSEDLAKIRNLLERLLKNEKFKKEADASESYDTKVGVRGQSSSPQLEELKRSPEGFKMRLLVEMTIADSYRAECTYDKAAELYLNIIEEVNKIRAQRMFEGLLRPLLQEFYTIAKRCYYRLIKMYMSEGNLKEIENYLNGIINKEMEQQKIQSERTRQIRVDLFYTYIFYGMIERAKEQYKKISGGSGEGKSVKDFAGQEWFFNIKDRLYTVSELYKKLEGLYGDIPRPENADPSLDQHWKREEEEEMQEKRATILKDSDQLSMRGVIEEERMLMEMLREKGSDIEKIRKTGEGMQILRAMIRENRGEISRELEELDIEKNQELDMNKYQKDTDGFLKGYIEFLKSEEEKEEQAWKDKEMWAERRLIERRFAEIYGKQKMYKEAEALYLYNLRLAVEDEREGAVTTVRRGLASLYYDQGKYRKAEELYKVVLRHQEKKLSNIHPDLNLTRYSLSKVFEAQKRYTEAVALLELSVESFACFFGEKHPFTLKKRKELSTLSSNQRKHERLVEAPKETSISTEMTHEENSRDTFALEDRVKDAIVFLRDRRNIKDVLRRDAEIEGLPSDGQSISADEGMEIVEKEENTELNYIMSAIFDQVLWYYDKTGKESYRERVLESILREPWAVNNQYKRVELAEEYSKQQRYLKVIRLYYETILSEKGVIESIDGNLNYIDDAVIMRVLQLLSNAYIMLDLKKKDLNYIDHGIRRMISHVESGLGFTNLRGIMKVNENLNRGYLSLKKYVQSSLRKNNRSAKTQFGIKNFLEIRQFDARITPITCLFGDNLSGKTVIVKVLHACQNWLYEDINIQEKKMEQSKDSYLWYLYQKMKEEGDENREMEEGEEIQILEMKDFFDEKLKEMIEYQIHSIPIYFVDKIEKPNKALGEFWQKIVKRDICTEFYGSNFFFDCKVSLYKEEENVKTKVELEWKNIEGLRLRVENNIAQLRIDVKESDNKTENTFFYYMFKKKNDDETNALPYNKGLPTRFFVDDMTMASLKVCVTNILFECTPFVFFEGKSITVPAHRTGLSIALPAISKATLFEKKAISVSQGDLEFIRFIQSYTQEESTTNVKNQIVNDKKSANKKIADKIGEAFSKIDTMNVQLNYKRDEISITFGEKEEGDTKTAQEVATSSLSLAPLNIYVKELIRWLEKDNKDETRMPPTTILYDEPEISLHPDHIVKLFEFVFYMYEELRGRNIPWSFVCITHSPMILEIMRNKAVNLFPDSVNLEDQFSPILLERENGQFVGRQMNIKEGKYEENPYADADWKRNKISIAREKAIGDIEKTIESSVEMFYQT